MWNSSRGACPYANPGPSTASLLELGFAPTGDLLRAPKPLSGIAISLALNSPLVDSDQQLFKPGRGAAALPGIAASPRRKGSAQPRIPSLRQMALAHETTYSRGPPASVNESVLDVWNISGDPFAQSLSGLTVDGPITRTSRTPTGWVSIWVLNGLKVC